MLLVSPMVVDVASCSLVVVLLLLLRCCCCCTMPTINVCVPQAADKHRPHSSQMGLRE